jgi:hypothetical protein
VPTVGAVELHVEEHAWRTHRHDRDPRYAAVVLHVALLRDGPSVTPPGIPLVILSEQFLQPYRSALRSALEADDMHAPMPCRDRIAAIPRGVVTAMLSLAAEERFAIKKQRVSSRWSELRAEGVAEPHVQLFSELLLRALGYGGNEDACERLARSLPHRVLISAGDAAERAAMLFVAAGIPRPSREELPKAWRGRFAEAMRVARGRMPRPADRSRASWNSSGVRPGNRIVPRLIWYASIAPLLADRRWWVDLFARVRNPGRAGEHAHDGLLAHLRMASHAAGAAPGLGRCREICINVVAPFAAAMAEHAGREDITRAAATLYHALTPAPENRVTRRLAEALRVAVPLNSGQQQGMLQLATGYCDPLRCADCLIGKACDAVR